MDDRIKYALRLARESGGEAKEEMVERAWWNPIRGLRIKPPAEKLSSEPDIREYQLKRHAHEFEGAPEPVAPTRKVVLDAPLFGGKKELGELPYDYAGTANTALNAIYGLKTAPLYTNPYTAPVGRALDAYEFAKKVEEDPSAVSSYTSLPKLLRGAGPLGLGAAGVGAAVAADEEESPEQRAYGGRAGMNVGGQPQQTGNFDQILNDAYRNYLGRAPDAPGKQYWAQQLQSGFSPERLGAAFRESEEGQDYSNAAVQNAYQTYLGRAPEMAGQNAWLGNFRAGALTMPEIVSQIQYSPEGQAYAGQLGKAFESAYGRAPRAATEALDWARAYREANPVTFSETSRFIPDKPLPNWNPNIVSTDVTAPPFNPVLEPPRVTPSPGTGAGQSAATPSTGGSPTTPENPLRPFDPNIPVPDMRTPGIGNNVVVPGTTTGSGTSAATPSTGGSPTTPDNRTELAPFKPNVPVPDMRTPGIGDNVIVPGTTTGAATGATTPGTGGSSATPDNRNEIPVWNPNIGRSDMATPPIAPPLEQLASKQITVDPKDHSSFVTSLYNSYLGRAPDVEGQQYFQSFLERGGSPAELAQAIATSPEAQMNQIGSMYKYVLGREGDQGGMDAFRNAIAEGRMNLSDVGQVMMQSPEYQGYLNNKFEAAKSGFNEVNPYDFAATALKGVGERGPMPDGYRDPNVWGVSESNDVFPTSFASTLLNKGLGPNQQLQAGYIDPNVMLSGKDNVADKYQFAANALKNGLGENGVYKPYVDASINAEKVNQNIYDYDPNDPAGFLTSVHRSLTGEAPKENQYADLSSQLLEGRILPKEAAAQIAQQVNAPLPPSRPSDEALTDLHNQNVGVFGRMGETLKSVVEKTGKTIAGIPGKLQEIFSPSNFKQEFIKAMDAAGIKDPATRAAMAANVQVETNFQNRPEVSYRNTSNSRIRGIFSNTRKLSDAQLNAIKADDKSFFNYVYGNKNGNEGGDDGYNYRGRGPVQLTGKANYRKYGELAGLGDQLVKNPDLMNNPVVSARVSVAYMNDMRQHHAGANDFEKITKGVNAFGPTVARKRQAFNLIAKGDEFAPLGPLGEPPPPETTAAEIPESIEAPLPPARPEEILQPNIGGGSGSVINMDSGFGGVGVGGSGEAAPGGGSSVHTGTHTNVPVHHTTPVSHSGATHTGATHSIGSGTHHSTPSSSHGSFSVGFAPDPGATHTGGNFQDYASSHGFGHTTVGQHYVPYNPIALPGAGGFSHGHHGSSHHGGQGGYWDPNWANSSMHSGGDQSFFNSGGRVKRAVKPDDEDVQNAVRLAKSKRKGGRINTKIDKDPDWDMSLKRGGSARG